MKFYLLLNGICIFCSIVFLIFSSQVNRILMCLVSSMILKYVEDLFCINIFFNSYHENIINEFALILLMFSLGSHFNLSKLKTFKKTISIAFLSQTSLIFIIFFILHYFLFTKLELSEMIFLSFAELIASTVISTQILINSDEFSSKYGQVTFAILVLQDIITIILLSISKGSSDFLRIPFKICLTFFVLPLIKNIVNMFYLFLIKNDKEDMCKIFPIFSTIFFMVLMKFLGTSYEFGAFCSGFINAQNPFYKDFEKFILPIQDYLICLFILNESKAILNCNLNLTIIIKFLIIYFIKILVTFFIGCLSEIKPTSSIKMSIVLSSFSEVNFIMFPSFLKNNPYYLSFGIFSTFFSMIISPFLFKLFIYLKNKHRLGIALEAASLETMEIENHVIIVGFGKLGKLIYEFLHKEVVPHIIIDNDIKLVSIEKTTHKNIYFMDSRFESTYKSIGINRALIVIITLRCINATIRTVKAIKNCNKNIKIAAIYYDKESFDLFKSIDAIPISYELGMTGKPLVDYINKIINK